MSMAALLLDFMKYERISTSIASSSCGTFLCKPMIGVFAIAFIVFSAHLLVLDILRLPSSALVCMVLLLC